VIAVDIIVLIYAHREGSAWHAAAMKALDARPRFWSILDSCRPESARLRLLDLD